ncbi:MAG TPA: hypothetical protein VH187_01450 [Scandinavium sp.]|jgi:hypothetical protein|uniref:hypothetical protein n=1 Tax=Scandinavium sp. TaxID=2830653 RepID=UPI002E340D4E|nr:hypothetical protein [Scandinavium sp.]HEX4499823.1 hypothetical protein [Scandinavium sp.]
MATKVFAELESIVTYSQSQQVDLNFPRESNESMSQYENRCWRLRCHTDDSGIVELPDKTLARVGNVIIPGMIFHRVLLESVKSTGETIPGRGKKTYLDAFRTGVMVDSNVLIGMQGKEIEGEWISVDPRGRPGGRGVPKKFPKFPAWKGTVEFMVFDEIVLNQSKRGVAIFEEALEQAGRFGIGRWRPIKSGGQYGRFRIVSLRIESVDTLSSAIENQAHMQ